VAAVDIQRRMDIMRNHTATHLLHAELHRVLGKHARQAGSLVAPDRLRFDFTHPNAVTPEQLDEIERGVNKAILENHHLNVTHKSLQEAISEGAMALFGEKYGEVVRTITIGEEAFSYELCGGTHVEETGHIGTFIIISEGSVSAGIRRIEAVTGREAYEIIQKRSTLLKNASAKLESSIENIVEKIDHLQSNLDDLRKENSKLKLLIAKTTFVSELENAQKIKGVPVVGKIIPEADTDTLRLMTDLFREKFSSGVVVVATVQENRPMIVACVTEDLVKRGLHAGNLVKHLAQIVGGGGGGRPTMAQAGGKDPEKLDFAMSQVREFVEKNLN
jgi:alanyl-tRNA synthetase